MSLHQKSEGFSFPLRQAEFLSRQSKIKRSSMVPFQQNGQTRPATV